MQLFDWICGNWDTPIETVHLYLLGRVSLFHKSVTSLKTRSCGDCQCGCDYRRCQWCGCGSCTPTRTVLYTQAAPVAQAKWVAAVLGGDKATIKDVFLSCVTVALAKQLA